MTHAIRIKLLHRGSIAAGKKVVSAKQDKSIGGTRTG